MCRLAGIVVFRYRIRKCVSTFRSLRGPPTSAAALLFHRVLVFGYEVWQFEDPLDLRAKHLRGADSMLAGSLHFRPDRRNRMELVRLLSAVLPSYNSLPPRSTDGRVAALAAGRLEADDVRNTHCRIVCAAVLCRTVPLVLWYDEWLFLHWLPLGGVCVGFRTPHPFLFFTRMHSSCTSFLPSAGRKSVSQS